MVVDDIIMGTDYRGHDKPSALEAVITKIVDKPWTGYTRFPKLVLHKPSSGSASVVALPQALSLPLCAKPWSINALRQRRCRAISTGGRDGKPMSETYIRPNVCQRPDFMQLNMAVAAQRSSSDNLASFELKALDRLRYLRRCRPSVLSCLVVPAHRIGF